MLLLYCRIWKQFVQWISDHNASIEISITSIESLRKKILPRYWPQFFPYTSKLLNFTSFNKPTHSSIVNSNLTNRNASLIVIQSRNLGCFHLNLDNDSASLIIIANELLLTTFDCTANEDQIDDFNRIVHSQIKHILRREEKNALFVFFKQKKNNNTLYAQRAKKISSIIFTGLQQTELIKPLPL